MDNHKTVKQRVLDILLRVYWDWTTFNHGHIFYNSQQIFHKDGWVAQSVLANPAITGSTEGKRRYRELRADISLQNQYVFETKHEHNRWFYRVQLRKQPSVKQELNQLKNFRLQFAEI